MGGEVGEPQARPLTVEVLEELARADATAAELAHRLGQARATASATIAQLVARGLIERVGPRPATYRLRPARSEAA